MRSIFLALLLLAAPLGALALTWDFDEGTAYGWTARESLFSDDFKGGLTVYSEVADGVWRIAPVPGAQRSAINLRSPLIGEDSALFDRVTLRLRILHHTPTEGRLQMAWFNTDYRRLNEEASQRGLESLSPFYVLRNQLYPTDWENITVDIRALEAALEDNYKGSTWWQTEIAWQDTLFDFQLELDLNTNPQGPDDHPVFLEVDWIQLTGVEELLLGELQPREIAGEAGLPGVLFAKPDFFPLGEGIEAIGGGLLPRSTLGDGDGDGDVDLVLSWLRHYIVNDETKTDWGWMVASNDGLGGFVPTLEVTLSRGEQGHFLQPVIEGGDFDGDGLLDLVYWDGGPIEVWHNRGKDGFATILQLSDVSFIGLADGDGDGDVDLLVKEVDDKSSHVILWFNDGHARFVRSERFVLDSEEPLDFWPLTGQPAGQAVRLLWTGPCYLPQETWLLTQPWAASKEPPLSVEAVIISCDLHLITDLDGDGQVEFIGPPDQNLQFDPFYTSTTYHGLALWRLDESGVLVRHTLLGPQVLVAHRVVASDLTGDGLLDLAVVDGNLATGPALVVLTGQRDGVPVVEGRYPLPGTGGPVLAGDVNGDGSTDLIVLGRSIQGGPGGAFVFVNQGVPATAIAAETTTTPTAFALGANYPNPFNPATTLPVSVAADGGEVDLTIYNVLGQPVRHVWKGPLAAGAHQLTWDGRDAQGQPVAAGVYVVRLRQDDQTRTRKMVKIE